MRATSVTNMVIIFKRGVLKVPSKSSNSYEAHSQQYFERNPTTEYSTDMGQVYSLKNTVSKWTTRNLFYMLLLSNLQSWS